MTNQNVNPPSERLVRALQEAQRQIDEARREKYEPIAVIGAACRFPGGCDSPEAFWRLLRDGVDACRPIPADRWNVDDYYDPSLNTPGKMYIREACTLDGVDRFDASFFGVTPREAAGMDPQQRLLLETSWEALERAGVAPGSLHETRTGVFIGIGQNDYARLKSPDADAAEAIDVYDGTGNGFCFASGRLSYVLGLQGPNLAVDTACSSSLVALHLACQSLRSKECDAALTGGVHLILSPEATLFLSRAQALAPDGRCKTFDDSADGYGRGEGCGVFVLKRLSDALRDRDTVWAVIRGSAVNHDGPSSGLTVPNAAAQQSVIRQALNAARVEPDDVQYIEAHGTGTPLGDPIELRSLGAVFGSKRTNPLWVGSVKANVGHLEAAAGAAGVLKIVLSMRYGEIPPQIHFSKPNTRVDWSKLPVRIPVRREEWTDGGRRIAGVSSFSLSGTNAHVVVEQAPVNEPVADSNIRPVHLLTISARGEAPLRELTNRYRTALLDSDAPLADFCHTANTGRTHCSHRLAVVAPSRDIMTARLEEALSVPGVHCGVVKSGANPSVAFLFTGQGAQAMGMGRELYRTEPRFRHVMDQCADILRSCSSVSLIDLLYGDSNAAGSIHETENAQPALFALEYALADLWMHWGVEPAAVLGHSLGEYAAVCVAGLWSLEDALRLVALRGRLMGALAREGCMAAVMAPFDRISSYLNSTPGVSVAAINAPEQIVLSGPQREMDEVLSKLDAGGVSIARLQTSHAFHSAAVEPILRTFEDEIESVRFTTPRFPIVSNLTGRMISFDEIRQPSYWSRHMREPVMFADGIKSLNGHDCRLFLEIGPRPILSGLGRQCIDGGEWLASLNPSRGDWESMLTALAALYTRGVEIDWRRVDDSESRRKIDLPTYPFQRQRYWIETSGVKKKQPQAISDSPYYGRELLSPVLDVILYESRVSLDAFPFLRDHRVFERVVIPAAAHLAMAIAVLNMRFPGCSFEFTGLQFPQALSIADDETYVLQTVLKPLDETSSFELSVFSRAVSSQSPEWALHAKSRVRSIHREAVPSGEGSPLEEIHLRCAQPLDATTLYDELRTRQIDLGPSFRWLDEVKSGSGEALCRLVSPDDLAPASGCHFHPGMLDSCLQALAAAVSSESDGTFIPYCIDRVVIHHVSAKFPAWAHARFQPSSDPQTYRGRIDVYNDDGALWIEFQDVQVRLATLDALRDESGDLSGWMYETVWRSVDPPSEENEKNLPTQWLVIGDSPFADRVQSELRRNALNCAVASSASEFDSILQNELMPEPFARLGVIFLGDPTTPSENDCSFTSPDPSACLSLVRFIQAAQSIKIPLLLRLVTIGAQAEGLSPHAVKPGSAALWGLAATLRLEHPEFDCRTIDLESIDDDLNSLVPWLIGSSHENEMILRGGEAFSPRLAPAPLARADFKFADERRCVMITGGLGALGRHAVECLSEWGVRRFVLVNRSRPDESALRWIETLSQKGVEIIPHQADVSSRKSLSELLNWTQSAGIEIGGVIHAAGVLDDGVLLQQDEMRFRRVWGPKTRGAWLLHELTKDVSLQFFVIYSSVAAILGSPGQGAYSAANAGADALIAHRRALGLPACTLNWGPWSGEGMAQNSRMQWEQAGVDPVTPERAASVLRAMLSIGCDQRTVFPVERFVRRMKESLTPRRMHDFVSAIDMTPCSDGSTEAVSFDGLNQTGPEERETLLMDYVCGLVCQVTRLRRDQIDEDAPLNTVGVDSLMALELRNRVQNDLRLEWPIVRFLDGTSIAEMAHRMSEEWPSMSANGKRASVDEPVMVEGEL
ncbi:MAG: SDR family NAD(P)-dependent oxidoreductase [bacterium]|nr:SDR family NAD(P)-dependent oxidoreductase [bacterium]